jgi:hypothetical protein
MEKAGSGLGMWSKKNFVLVVNKLMYYEPDNKARVKGVLDFNLITCAIKVSRKDIRAFKILTYKSDRVFHFKCSTEQERKEWVKAINEQIVSSKGYQRNLTKVARQPSFWKFDRITQKELMETANTGDIILFRTYGLMSKFQRLVTWSRVGNTKH